MHKLNITFFHLHVGKLCPWSWYNVIIFRIMSRKSRSANIVWDPYFSCECRTEFCREHGLSSTGWQRVCIVKLMDINRPIFTHKIQFWYIKKKSKMIPLQAWLWPRGWVEVYLYSSMTATLEVSEWLAARPGRTLPPGKSRYPLYRRLGGPPGPVWTGKNLAPPGFAPRPSSR